MRHKSRIIRKNVGNIKTIQSWAVQNITCNKWKKLRPNMIPWWTTNLPRLDVHPRRECNFCLLQWADYKWQHVDERHESVETLGAFDGDPQQASRARRDAAAVTWSLLALTVALFIASTVIREHRRIACTCVARILSGVHFFPQKSWRPFFSRRPQKEKKLY